MRINSHVKARLVAALFITSFGLTAAPVTNDLWDSSRPGFSVLTATPGLLCGVESNVFGTAIAGSCPSGPAEGLNGNVVFQEGAGQVSRLEWNTLLIELTSFEFNYGLNELGRTAAGFQLFAWDGTSFQSFYTNASLSQSSGTLAVILGSSVTSDRWRAEITNSNVSPFSGARIQELDGFGQLASANGVPEPATMFVAGAGLLLLVLQRKGRKA
ncbi:MAG: PEP-CTERM sorting domain-containing protein [Acidobacteriota bacterium]